MDWLLAATGSAIVFGLNNVIAKHLMDDTTGFTYTYLYSLLATVFYTPVFAYLVFNSTITINPVLLAAIAISGLGNIAAFLVYNLSIKGGALSEIIPLTKLTPIFTALTGALVLAEKLTPVNMAGIGLVTLGSYIVLRHPHENLFSPLKKAWSSRPHRFAIYSALIWGFVAVVDRYATQRIDPAAYTYFIYLLMTAGFTTHIVKHEERTIRSIKQSFHENHLLYTITGVMAATGSLLIFTAFSLAPASKVIPILQIQVLISVLAGLTLFNEKGYRQKIIGSAVLIAGVILVSL